MIKIEHVVLPSPDQWAAIIRGMRNPWNSWGKSDTDMDWPEHPDVLKIGPNDYNLMERLANGGPVHAKYRRMIVVYVDITAPLYWWKEFDTYKIGTVANSCSTMHKIADKEFTLDDFSCEHLFSHSAETEIYHASYTSPFIDGEIQWTPGTCLITTIFMLNHYRGKYLEAKTKPLKDNTIRESLMKEYWWQMIQLLPSSYNQKRTVMLNYEILVGIYKYRKDHRLDEWKDFCKWIESLPYSEIITGAKENTNNE